MRNSVNLFIMLLLATAILPGCSGKKNLLFADRQWHISDYYGQIIDRDTTWRMTFGNILIPAAMPIISCRDSVKRYPGMEEFMADILHTARLDSAEILFYAPCMNTMFVRPGKAPDPTRPSSITSPLDGTPYRMWIDKEDQEDWKRTDKEMYTYTYFSKRRKQCLVVDFYNYGDIPIAQIFIYQTRNRKTDRMKLPTPFRLPFYRHDITDPSDIEFWAHQIEYQHSIALANYLIGQELKK